MALTFEELESVTNDYFLADNRKAIDIYFNDCFLVDYFMNKKKGIFKRYPGGRLIRIPLSYDGQEGGFYSRGEALSSDDRELVNAAYFRQKHAYGNATVYRPDELENAGEYAEVELVTTKLEAAQKTIRKQIATDLYSSNSDSAKGLTGLNTCCFGAATTNFGGLAENDVVAADLDKPWAAKGTTTAEAISLAVLRTQRSTAKIGNGAFGKPNICLMTETLFNIVSGILQVQQRFTENKETTEAGFTNLVFDGMLIAADDYCTGGYDYMINSKYYGFAIHSQGYFVREPWANLSSNGPAGKTMKIYWDGNSVVSNRKAHCGHKSLS
ncbi:MAG: phage major capsid protein [Desulfobacteraceae bacterium]|nr:phage major capsid protein [Desulfobacteraceae bacterium]